MSKGSEYELAVHKVMNEAFGTRWIRLNGTGHEGADGLLMPPGLHTVSVECKNQKEMRLASWVDQAVEQSNGHPAVVIHKRPRRGDVLKHYATMEVSDFITITGGSDVG